MAATSAVAVTSDPRESPDQQAPPAVQDPAAVLDAMEARIFAEKGDPLDEPAPDVDLLQSDVEPPV